MEDNYYVSKSNLRVPGGLVPRQHYMILGGPGMAPFLFGMLTASDIGYSVKEGVFDDGVAVVGMEQGDRWIVQGCALIHVQRFEDERLERRRTHAITVLADALEERYRLKRSGQKHTHPLGEPRDEWHVRARLSWKEQGGLGSV